MTYSNINSCTSRNVSTSSNFIITISTEKSKYEMNSVLFVSRNLTVYDDAFEQQ